MQYNIDVLVKGGTNNGGNSRDTKIFRNMEDQVDPLLSIENMTIPISIVFWDISGFSRLYRTFSMVDKEIYMLDFLNQYYLIARKTISKNNGMLDKAIGDGIMSWFGAIKDTTFDDGANDAINAAIELRTCFEELQRQFRKKWDIFEIQIPEFGLKCGINTGIAKVCILYNQCTVMGTSVNLASRLQQYAKSNQIIISDTTKQKLQLKKYDLCEILIDTNCPIKSFEDIRICFEISRS
jgi:class 3 adenylate cyclase